MTYHCASRVVMFVGTIAVSAFVLTMLPGRVEVRATSPAPIPFTHVVIDSNPPRWKHTKTVGDIDGDGFDDVLTGGAVTGDGLYWYRYPNWDRFTIVPPDSAIFTTDMQVGDIDRDGDLDVIIPQGASSGVGLSVWWYENPRPGGKPSVDPWPEHSIGIGAAHDLEVSDFDNDGWLDVVSRSDSVTLYLQDGAGGWNLTVINHRSEEGLAVGDIDRDGDFDLATNGYWLENPLPLSNPGSGPWTEYVIDPTWPAQVGVHIADLNGDGRPDVVFAPAETPDFRFSWYAGPLDPKAGPWIEHVIDNNVSYFHTYKIADMDIDGDLDLVTAEMHQSVDPDEVSVYRNEGQGLAWTQDIVATKGSHNLRLTDIDEDGDIDIVGANWDATQVLDLFRNDLDPKLDLDSWQRHVVDENLPWRSIFVATADLDRDGAEDIVTGGWWYRNPGSAAGAWVRDTLGTPLRNMAVVHDMDLDGDFDVLGTRGVGSQSNDSLVWARNDGAGSFTILANIQPASGDFLQGAVARPFANDGHPSVLLSWHQVGTSVQRLTVPLDASNDTWLWDEVTPLSQLEDLSVGDIDRDGDLDVLQGTQWLRNDGAVWAAFGVSGVPEEPDRNRLADINRDGRLDAIVGFQAVSVPGKLAWYEQGASPTDPWTEHVIATLIGPMSLDVVDMDSDGDFDVIVGEHNLSVPASAGCFVFENADGVGSAWIQHTVYVGDEHHDGTHVCDIDSDGDMDIVSIGWDNDRLVLYENRAQSTGPPVNFPPVASLVVTPTSGLAPLVVNFDGSASVDPEGAPLLYTWDFGDGSPLESGETTFHTYDTEGTFVVTLTVSDGLSTDVATTSIVVGNLPGPVAGLIHHWRLDDGTGGIAADAAGGADGILAGPQWVQHGKSGGSLRFDGVDDRVDLGNVDVTGGSGITIACWFKADDFGVHDARFVTKATGTATSDHYWMVSTINQTALRFRLKAGGTTSLLLTSTGEISARQWYHVAATYDGTAMRIYKNGEEVAILAKTGTVDTNPAVAAAIGDQPPSAGNLPFDGLIDDVRIYNRALSPVEIDSLFAYRLFIGVTGAGTVVRQPDSLYHLIGDTVIVTAVPDTGWSFTGWSDGLGGSENPDTVVVLNDTTITGNFDPIPYTLAINVTGSGIVTRSPNQPSYVFGDTVVVVALPDPGWSFDGWSGALSGAENPDTLVVTSDTTVSAAFTMDIYTVTVDVEGLGTVTLSQTIGPTQAAPSDTAFYVYGDSVILEATASTGWHFAGWSGGITSDKNPDTMVVVSDTMIVATFVEDLYTLTVDVAGNGSVSRSPDQPTYLYGDTVMIVATPDPAWVFGGWAGAVTGTQNPDTIVMVSDTTLVATFELPVVLATAVIGNGGVQLDPGGPSYFRGDTIAVTAVPDPGWSFDGWSGPLSGGENPDTFVIQTDTTITAAFTLDIYELLVTIDGEGVVALTQMIRPAGPASLADNKAFFVYGDTVLVEARPDSGWNFAGWSGGLTGNENPDTLVIFSDSALTASFVPENALFVTVNVDGGGSVLRIPSAAWYAPGDTVSFEAVPDSGWAFGGWSDGLMGTQNPDSIVLLGDTVVTATFLPAVHAVLVDIVGNGTVTRVPDKALYANGELVVLSAEGDPGWTLREWSGDLSGAANPDTLIVSDSLRILARFETSATGIDRPPHIAVFEVLQNAPNPFTDETYIDYGLPGDADVRIQVYDVAGRRVFEHKVGGVPGGWHRYRFRGRDHRGAPLPSGVYFYRVWAGERVETRRMVILR